MRAVYRKLTVLLITASYLLGVVATWLHHSPSCSGSHAGRHVLITSCGGCCDDPQAGVRGVSQLADVDRDLGKPAQGPRFEHRHESDACLLCRFSVIQKTVAVPPDIATFVQCPPEPVAVILPAWRVAELLATPDCRAPPHQA